MRHGHDRAGHALCTDAQSVNGAYRAMACTRKAKAHVGVAVGWVVPVPVRGANVDRVVVPAATANDAVDASGLSAWNQCITNQLAAQVQRIGVADMTEQSGAGGSQLVCIHFSMQAGFLSGFQLAPESP